MAIYKRATCSMSIVASSSVYICDGCGYTEMIRGNMKQGSSSKKCPNCGGILNVVSSGPSEPIQTELPFDTDTDDK